MALQSCYECNKEISTKAIICPQCGAPQNPVSGLVDKAKDGFLGKAFKNLKENATKAIDRKMEEVKIKRKIEENLASNVERVTFRGLVSGRACSD